MHAISIRRERFEAPWLMLRRRGQQLARQRSGRVYLLQLDRRLTGQDLRWHLRRRTPDVESRAQLRRQAAHQITDIRPRKTRREQFLHPPRTALFAQLEQLRGVLLG